MKYIDGTDVPVFGPDDERLHPPGPEENWQESFVLYWYDQARRVGGGFRLAREANLDGGRSQFSIVILSPDGVYRRCGSLPLRPGDVTDDGLDNGDGALRYSFDGERIAWTLDDETVRAELSVELTVPPIDPHGQAGLGTAESVLSAHVDAACHVTGTMEVRGTTYDVDALAVRDHAWGTRDLGALRSHRWCNASLGPDLSFVAMTFLSADDRLARVGWVVRGDTVTLARDVRTRTVVTDDGVTNLGGTVAMTLTTGEVFEARFEPLHPTVSLDFVQTHPAFYQDAYCRVTAGDAVGFGIFESSHNSRGGTLVPRVADGSVASDGWHDAAPA